MFTDLHITDFRGIEDLKLSDLGRVNLIVGENNTGKTTLLEAISLGAAPEDAGSVLHRFRLWSGTRNPGRWLRRDGCKSDASLIELNGMSGHAVVALSENLGHTLTWKGHILHEVNSPGHVQLWRDSDSRSAKIRSVSVQPRSPSDLVHDFTAAVRSKQGEKELETLLHDVDDRIQAVRLDYEKDNNQPYISADIGLSERVPIEQLGQGVNRLIAIFSELLGQRPGLCFIDEVETGLHYSVLERVWQGIAAAAERLDIQIFATTHSRECLEAAHRCYEKRASYDLRVVKLYRVRERIGGRVLDRPLIEAAVESDIEVRG